MKVHSILFCLCFVVVAVSASFKHSVFSHLRSKMHEEGLSSPFPGPICPPRPKIPKKPDMLPDSLIEAIGEGIAKATVAKCNEDPLSPAQPSATAMTMAIVVGDEGPSRRPQNTVFRSYGCLNKSLPEGPDNTPTEDTIFRLASCSKTFAVELVLNALRADYIKSWDDHVNQYFPDFFVRNPFGDGAQPTFKEMCSQLAGLPRAEPCNNPCNHTSEEMISRIAKYNELIHPPNTFPSYSNLAYSVLGNLVSERIYGKPFQDVLKDQLTDILNLNSTGVIFTPEVRARMAVEYIVGGGVAPFADLGWQNPSGGMYSTARDLSKWLRYFLTDWKRTSWRKSKMQIIYLNGDGETGFGAPWEFFTSNGYLVASKGGNIRGVTALLAMVPELSLGMTFLWNGEGIEEQNVGKAAMDAVLPFLISSYQKAAIQDFPAFDPAFCDKYCNITFSSDVEGQVMEVTVQPTTNTNISAVPFLSFKVSSGPMYSLAALIPHKKQAAKSFPYDAEFSLQPYFPPTDSAQCLAAEFQANLGERAYFLVDPTSGNRQVILPGLAFSYFTGPPM